MVNRHGIVFRMVGQRDKTREAIGLILQCTQLAQVIDAVGKALDVAKKHRACATPAHPVPSAVDIRPFLGGFLAFGNLLANWLHARFGSGEQLTRDNDKTSPPTRSKLGNSTQDVDKTVPESLGPPERKSVVLGP